MTPSLLALLLACSPSMPATQTFEGPGVKLRQTVKDWKATAELVGPDGKVRWKVEDSGGFFAPTFSPDGRYVAEASTAHSATVRVIGPDGRLAGYEPLALVSEDEKSLMGWTSCGRAWFGGLRFEGETLVVLGQQAPPRPPMEPPDPTPKLEILIDLASGKLSRKTAAKVVTVASLIADYHARPEARRETAQALSRKASQREKADAPALLAFAKAQLPKTEDAGVQGALLSILDVTASDDDREWVAQRALKAGWPAGSVLTVLIRLRSSRPEPLRAYARAVLEQRLGDVNARAEAVRQLVSAPDGLKYVRIALEDPERYVRESAQLVLGNLPADDQTFLFLVERAAEPSARKGLVDLFVRPREWRERGASEPNPFAARFEKACDGALQKAWPGCEAWTGAMADARGDRGLASQRYTRALAAISAELSKTKGWSPEVETFTRLHVRLAWLAKDEGRPQEVVDHVKALERSPAWGNFRVECSNGLPRGFGECDGGHYRDLVISELLGTPTPD